jgi:hypothetical protein
MERDSISCALTQPGILRSMLGVGPQDLQVLQHRIADLEASGVNAHPAEWNTLKAQIKLLEACLLTDPVTIGGRTFNSKADVALFMELVAMYQASRMGFDEDEATHVYTFKLIIPSLLGATKDGDKNDPKLTLPAIKDFSAWIPQDNEGGVKKHLQDGLDDVSIAVTESIAVYHGLVVQNLLLKCSINHNCLSTNFVVG